MGFRNIVGWVFAPPQIDIHRLRSLQDGFVHHVSRMPQCVQEIFRRVGTPCPPSLGKTIHAAAQRHGGQRLPTLHLNGSRPGGNAP